MYMHDTVGKISEEISRERVCVWRGSGEGLKVDGSKRMVREVREG